MISDSDYILELNVVPFIYVMFIFILKSEVKLFNFFIVVKITHPLTQLYPFFIVDVCTLFREDREWLMVIQCTNHRLELAMKDAFLADAAFKEVDKVLLEMYLITRDSGKVKGLLKSTVDSLYLDYFLSRTSLYFEQKARSLGHLCTL